MPTDELDTKDSAILQLLKNNARLTYSEIGTQVGLTRTAVKNRVSALEKSGVIKGYQAIIEPLVLVVISPLYSSNPSKIEFITPLPLVSVKNSFL